MPQTCGTSVEVIGAQGDPEREARAASRRRVAVQPETRVSRSTRAP